MADEAATLWGCARQLALTQMNDQGLRVRDLHDQLLQQVEPPVISAVLHRCGGNQTAAARVLGLARNTLRKKMARYGFLPQ